MNFGRFFLGFFIVLVGLVLLLNSLNIFVLNINLWNLWPVLIIFVGLSFFNSKNMFSIILGVVVTVLSIIMLFLSFFNPYVAVEKSQMLYFPVSIAKDSDVQTAVVKINASGTDFAVAGSDSGDLVSGGLRSNMASLKTDSVSAGGVQKVDLSLSGGKRWINGGIKNNLDVGLNKSVPMEIVLNSGASTGNIDLSQVTAQKADIVSGASKTSIKLGEKADVADISIAAGASSIDLILPWGAGVKVVTESDSVSKSLSGLTLVDKNTYQSSNYASALKKININIDMDISSLKIDWYQTADAISPAPSGQASSSVSLFYYKRSLDAKNACTSEFVLPVTRQVPVSDNRIKDAINLLLEGSLTSQEMEDGFYPYFPNRDFKLLSSKLDADGTLTLTFNEVAGFTSGNFCRNNILALEIAKTAKQFPEVKKVVFEPDSLF